MNDRFHFSKTIEEQAKILLQVFDRIREAKFTLNLAKSHFAGREGGRVFGSHREIGVPSFGSM